MELKQSHFRRENQRTLNLDCEILVLDNVDINYECFFLTTNASKLRKLVISRTKHKKWLSHKDLLFISGFYNLESIAIDGKIENYQQIQKLERLIQTEANELEKTRQKRIQMYDKIRMEDSNEERLK